jgi:predicted nucleotidyltransferase
MNNASNPTLTLSKSPTEDFMRVVRELNASAIRLGIPFFLAGAAARGLVLVDLWGQTPGGATADIDFAFAVDTWGQFEQLREELLATNHFERVPHKQQRLQYADPESGFQVPVDFIPFGGVASGTQTISWPPEGDFVMNVAGFEEALAAALRIELEPGLTISVVSLPGLAILKLIAWDDRNLQNNKDAADLYKLLTTFSRAGNEDRIWDREPELLESLEYDLTLVGATILGRDAARLVDFAAAAQLANLLTSNTKIDLLVSHMIATSSYEENAARVARLFECFRAGYLGDSNIPASERD